MIKDNEYFPKFDPEYRGVKYFRNLLIIFTILTSNNLFSQISFSKQYTINDGLQSSVIFDIEQDNSGYIWIATNYGICRFDGYHFKTYTTNDGLPANSTIEIFTGKNNKLWFLSFTGKLSCISNGTINPFPLNDTLQAICESNYKKYIFIDSLDNIYLSSKNKNKVYKITPKLNITEKELSINHYLTEPNIFKYSILTKNASDTNYLNRNQIKHLYEYQKMIFHHDRKFTNKYYKIRNKLYKLSISNKLEYVNIFSPNTNYKNIKIDAENIYQEKNGLIWINKRIDGILLYKNGITTKKPLHLFKNIRITRILKDVENNYWFTSDGNGIYFVPSFQFSLFNSNNGINNDNIISLETYANTLFFSTNDGKIYKSLLNNKGEIISYREFLKNDNEKYGRDILCSSDSSVWIVHSKYLKYKHNCKALPLDIIVLNKKYELAEKKNKNILISSNSAFFEYQNSKLIYDSRKDGFDEHIRCIHEDNNEIVWLGSMNGLFSYNKHKYKYYGDKNTLLSHRITDICSMNNILIVGTYFNGLVFSKSDSIINLTTNDGLSSNAIRTICIENDSTIWVGTNNGLNKIEFIDSNKKFNIINYSIWDGLPSNEINDICKYFDKIIIATTKGILTIDPKKLSKSNIPPRTHITNININNSKDTIILNDKLLLKSNETQIRIDYIGLCYQYPGKINYKYKLIWEDDFYSPFSQKPVSNNNWIYTYNTSAIFNLIPGEYTFLLNSSNSKGYWNEKPKIIKFSITKNFTNQIWFHLLITLIVLCAIFGIFLIIFKSHKKRTTIKHNVLLTEIKSLRSQMNPHFIFNSLNSIQHFILEKDDKAVDLYLANFSSLMRKVLENSKHNYISLHNELETIKLYIDIESLRFEKEFEYKLNIDENINPENAQIPPMLLQPFLENAIWHGLMMKKSKGILELEIEIHNRNTLKCIITDNGIGRKKASVYNARKKNHKSTGIQNIEERIALINKMNKSNLSIKITDIYDKINNPAGTKIEIFIPYKIEE